MAIQVLDGFDTYRSFFQGGADSIYGSGWVLTQSQTSQTYFSNEFVSAQGMGRSALLASYSYEDNYISKAIPERASYCAGVQVKRYLSNANGPQAINSVLGLYSSDGAQYVRVGIGASTLSPFYLETSDDVTRYEAGRPSGITQQFYLELEVIGTSAAFYINGALMATTTLLTEVTFSSVRLGGKDNQPTLGLKTGFYYNDCYVTDLLGVNPVGRLGPITIVPCIPTSDGSAGSGFSTLPDTPGKYDKVNDYAAGETSDADLTYLYSASSGANQTVHCTPEIGFSGAALGGILFASCKSDNPADNEIKLLTLHGGNELATDAVPAPVGEYAIISSEVFTALPDGSLLTYETLQAAEFGMRLARAT